MGKAIVLAVVVIVGGIVLTLVAAGPLGDCAPDPALAQMECAPSGLVWVGIAAIVVGTVGLFAVPIAWVSRSTGSGTGRAAALGRLQQTGVPGSARIVSVAETGLTVNDAPQFDLVLAVTVASRPAYEVARRELVPLLAIGRLTDGRPLRVLVDPQRPDQLAIDWLAQP